MTSDSTNFAVLFQIKDTPACFGFSLFPKRSINFFAAVKFQIEAQGLFILVSNGQSIIASQSNGQ